jgi:hypothetical protein
VIELAGQSYHQVPADSKYMREDPIWSPDGARILYSERRVTRDFNIDTCLMVVGVDGSGARRLFDGPPSWLYFLPFVSGQNDVQPCWWAPNE